MRRLLFAVRLAGAWAASSAVCLAQDPATPTATWPTIPDPMSYGPGLYLSWWKLLLFWLVFLLWVRSLDWVNRDAQILGLDYRRWNTIVFGIFVAGILLLWMLPVDAAFFVAYPLLVIGYLVPFFLYVRVRNKAVMWEDKVFTPNHIKRWLADTLRPLGVKIKVEPPKEAGPPLQLVATAGNERDNNVAQLSAKRLPGSIAARELLFEVLKKQADAVMLDYTQENVAIRHRIDGMWHDSATRDRPSGDELLVALKTVAVLNAQERRAKQQSRFVAEVPDPNNAHKKLKYTCRIVSQGTKTGERVVIDVDEGSRPLRRLPELGMRDKQVELIKQTLEDHTGLAIFSTIPGGGLSNLVAAALAGMDRYIRTMVTIEEANTLEPTVENVAPKKYDAAAGETPATILPKLIREYPDAIVCGSVSDAASAAILVAQAKEKRLILIGLRAKDAVDSMARMIALKVNPAELGERLLLVVHERMIRKLCEACKTPYPPTPQVLQQLGIPAGKVEAFYAPGQHKRDKPNEVCPECHGLGYVGRTGLFEVLPVDDTVRQVLASKQLSVDLLRKAARKAGLRTLQEEGVALVARGVTSLQELSRVLKE